MTPPETTLPLQGGAIRSPWTYRTGMLFDWGWITDCDDNFVCQAKGPHRDGATLAAHRSAKTDPWEARARLIAAAPDAIAACKAMVAYDECSNPEGFDFMALYDQAMTAARAAISKAHGGEHG